MDDPKKEPLIFADRVIHKFVSNMLGSMQVTSEDLLFIKNIFRNCGGSWEGIVKGDIRNTLILEQVVSQWGLQPWRKKKPSA